MVLGNVQTTVVFVQHRTVAVHHVASRLPYRLDRRRRSNEGVVVVRRANLGPYLRAVTRPYSLGCKKLRSLVETRALFATGDWLSDKAGAEDGLRREP